MRKALLALVLGAVPFWAQAQGVNIKDLPPATTPLSSSDLFAVTQGGTFHKLPGTSLGLAAGLGTMATQNANGVAITGGTITGVTDLTVGNAVTSPPTNALVINNAATTPQATSAFTKIWATNEGTVVQALLDTYSSASTAHSGWLTGRRARGTAASPTALGQGDSLLILNGVGRGTTHYSDNKALIVLSTSENWSDAAQGTNEQFWTTTPGTTTTVQRMGIGQGVFLLDSSGTVPPTGDLGAGTINVPTTGGYYINGAAIAGFNCLNITAYGGVGDDSTDNAAAFAAALAAGLTNQKCVAFPAGVFKFNSAISATLASASGGLTIVGAGSEVTTLHFPNAVTTALTVTQKGPNNAVHFRGFSMTTDTNKADVGILLTTTYSPVALEGVNYGLSEFSDITLRGSDGFSLTHNWATGVKVVNVGNVNFTGVNVFGAGAGWATSSEGDGVSVASTLSDVAPVVLNFVGCNFVRTNNGIILGQNVQGATIEQSNFTGNNNGVLTPSSTVGYSQLNISNSQFNDRTGVNLQSAIPGTNISNNLFIVEGTLSSPVAINLNNSANAFTIISGNVITEGSIGGGVGINVGSNVGGAVGGTITSNIIIGKDTGIALSPGAAKYTVANNQYLANTTDVVSDLGANVVDTPLDCSSGFKIQFGGASVGQTYSAVLCSYFQVGKQVTVAMNLGLTNKGSSTGNATVGPLPVTSTSASENGAGDVSSYSNFSSATGLNGFVAPSSSVMSFQVNGATGSTLATDSNFTNTSIVQLRLTYRVP